MYACRSPNKIPAVTGRFLFVCGALLLSASGVFADSEYQRTKDGKTMVWNNDPKPGDEATWLGDRDREGYATGFGTLTWYTTAPKGESGFAKPVVYARYWGNMVRGKFDGPVNAHSKGKTDYAIFVDGKRTTRWATGTAPSWRVAYARVERTVKPAAAAEAPAKEPPTVRETENVQRSIEEASAERSPAVGQAENVQRRTSNVQRSMEETVTERSLSARKTENAQPAFAVSARRADSSGGERSIRLRTGASEKAPTWESLREQAAQSPVEDSRANELSLRQATPVEPPIIAEPPSVEPSPVAEPEAPAEGPRVARAESSSRLPNDPSQHTPSSESFPDQRPPTSKQDTPSVSIQLSKESVSPPPTRTKSQAGDEDTMQSFVLSPSSLVPIPGIASLPEAYPHRLTKEQVIEIANAVARGNGYNRLDYDRAEPQYNAVHKVWSVSYDQSEAEEVEGAVKHFNVIVDDNTKGTVLVPRR